MRKVKGGVKMIPIPMREDDRRLLTSLDIENGRKGVSIEGDRKSDIEVQNGAAGIIAKRDEIRLAHVSDQDRRGLRNTLEDR